jgi:hypothetical protein
MEFKETGTYLPLTQRPPSYTFVWACPRDWRWEWQAQGTKAFALAGIWAPQHPSMVTVTIASGISCPSAKTGEGDSWIGTISLYYRVSNLSASCLATSRGQQKAHTGSTPALVHLNLSDHPISGHSFIRLLSNTRSVPGTGFGSFTIGWSLGELQIFQVSGSFAAKWGP